MSVDLAEVTKTLNEYLTSAGKRRPFTDDDRPLDLKHLKVVAFIQDKESKEVLQAAQVELGEAKVELKPAAKAVAD